MTVRRIFFVLIMLLGMLPVMAMTACGQGDTYPQEEANPDTDFEYMVQEDGSISITKYIGSDTDVIIPQIIEKGKVVGIASDAFTKIPITSVMMPDTVTVIGSSAFAECTELANVRFSKNLEHIVLGAFWGCTSLTHVDLSNTSIDIIGDSAFRACTNLQEIKFGDKLTRIEQLAFYQCSSLTDVHLPASLLEIERAAFAECTSLQNVIIPAQLELKITDEPRFYNNPSLEKIIFEEGREIIGVDKGDCYGYFNITTNVEIVVPNGVKTFSAHPFVVKQTDPLTPIKITFAGDCPEFVDDTDYLGAPTFYYYPNTKGWENCPWRDKYTFEAMP